MVGREGGNIPVSVLTALPPLSSVVVVVDILPPPLLLLLVLLVLLLPFCDFLLNSEPAGAVVPVVVPTPLLAVDGDPPPGTAVELPINKTLAIDRLEEPPHISNG